MITAINCIPHFEIITTFLYRITENEGQQNNEFFLVGNAFLTTT